MSIESEFSSVGDSLHLEPSAEDLLKEKTAMIRQRPQYQQQPSIYEYDREIIYLRLDERRVTRVTLYTPLSEEEKISRSLLNPKI